MTTTLAPSFKALFRSLDFDRPLNVADAKDAALYVENMHVSNGFFSPVDELRSSIEMSERPGPWFFTGHRGVGKSTELRRMARDLRLEGHLVIVADVGEYLNLAEPIDTVTLLLILAAALADGSEAAFGEGSRLKAGWGERFWNYLRRTEVDLKEFEVHAGPLTPKIELKENPVFRERVVRAVEGSLGTLAAEVREFAKPIADEWRRKQGNEEARVILILDSLERLRLTSTKANICYDAIVGTFDTHAVHLNMEYIDVVYSVPPYLPHLVAKLGAYSGVGVCTLPHVKVFKTPQKGMDVPSNPCSDGVDLMVKTVLKRYPEVEKLIPLDILKRLALSSSGGMRDYFRLLRSVCAKANVSNAPIPLQGEQLANAAEQDLRSEMPLADDDKAWLRIVHQTHGTGLSSIGNLHGLARLFDNGLILNYRNGEPWCDVQYLLQADLAA